jgi:hypothetical protein
VDKDNFGSIYIPEGEKTVALNLKTLPFESLQHIEKTIMVMLINIT